LLPITLGDDIAKSLGVNPIKTRVYLMSISAALAGSSVYAGGLIGFVALILISTIIGGLLTLISDQLARLIFAPIELPVGLATTVLGAPLMMYLAWRYK